MMMTSDFKPEVELYLFHACAVKNMPYNCYLPLKKNNHVVQEIGVEELDDVRFHTGNGNVTVSRMRDEQYAI